MLFQLTHGLYRSYDYVSGDLVNGKW